MNNQQSAINNNAYYYIFLYTFIYSVLKWDLTRINSRVFTYK